MIVGREAAGKATSTVSISQIRLIELIAIFCIVYISREIAGFVYEADLIVGLFLGSAFLSLVIAGVENWLYRHAAGMRGNIVPWLTVGIDLATVLALVYLTGTAESPFLFLLVIPLFFAGRLVSPLRAGLIVTGSTCAVIVVLGTLEIHDVIPHFTCYEGVAEYLANPHYLVGTVLVLGGFMSLMTYLFHIFHENFGVYFKRAEDRLISSRRRILELTRLYDISLGINSVISLDTLLKMVCKEITLLLGRPWATVILFNQKREVVKHVELGDRGIIEIESAAGEGEDSLLAEIFGFEDGLVINDVSGDRVASGSQLVGGRGLAALLAVPIFSGRERLGVLLSGDNVEEPFTSEDIRLLTILSGQVATAIEKSKLYEVMSGRVSRLERENEDLRGSNSLKMNYISHLSHELKTPLTSIKAYTESLRDNLENPDFNERDEFLKVIGNETERLIRMVNKVLDISKIEFGQRTLKRKLFELSALLADVEYTVQPYMREKGLHLIVKLPSNLPLIDGDEDLIKQVFINLIGNAIKFSSRGSRIFISAVEDAVAVKISVRDEGAGIPEKDLSNIFKQFFQVQTGMGDGVGLGLAIVKNIVEQHGGSIHVTSRMGEGSEFTFTLPKEHHFNDLLGYLFDSMDAKDELQEMFHLSATVIAEMLSVKIVSIMLLDRERRELFIKDAYGLDEAIVSKTRVPLGSSIAGRVAQSGEPLLVENVEEHAFKGAPNNPQYETKSLVCVPVRVGTTVLGVINANNKTDGEPMTNDDLTLLTTLSQRLSKVIERMRTADDSHAFLKETIESLRSVLEVQERNRDGIGTKVIEWSVRMARKLGLTEKETQVVQYVSSVYDVGMTAVSEDILKKTLELSAAELDEIHKHPQKSEAIMRPFEFVELVSQNILFHHERIDGKGYPMGLRGDQIPIGSRILSVIDAFASMVSERPFRPKMRPEQAVEELIRCSGTQFDGTVVRAFIEVLVDEGLIGVEEYSRINENFSSRGKHHVLP